MCGIVGYIGNKQAAPILLDELSKLEYRGYDSAGVAVKNAEGKHVIVKAKGKLRVLSDMIDGGETLEGTCGIGHTRWATHGVPSEVNAHPHCSDDMNVVAVHNGIIENYIELKDKLLKKGYSFYSQTDTEIATKLVDYYYKKWHDPLDAMASFTLRARGSFALAVMFADYPDEIFVARKDSPLIIGVNGEETFLASDVPAIIKYTKNVYYVGNMEIAHLQKGKVNFYNLDRNELKREPSEINWDADSADKGEYPHYMIKEIHEQPKAVAATLNAYLKGEDIDLSATGLTDEKLASYNSICIVACGSAYHAGVVMQYVAEDLARIPVRCELASEFRYRKPVLTKDTLTVFISQSGETADTLAALKEAKEQGYPTLGIVNVDNSLIAREADMVMLTCAGPEISVATTKGYSVQLIAAYLISLRLAYVRKTIDRAEYLHLLSEMKTLPDKIEKILIESDKFQWFANRISNRKDIFFVGRGVDYAVCLEGSLKLKEISYIHSEAYAAGELKHGTLSLIEENTLVVGVSTDKSLMDKTVNNLSEVKSRGAYVAVITSRGNFSIENTSDFTVYIPKTNAHFSASLSVIPLQLISYYVTLSKGLDVDKPRNLAKSVTVE